MKFLSSGKRQAAKQKISPQDQEGRSCKINTIAHHDGWIFSERLILEYEHHYQ
jgi:hypothetical protein